MFDQVGDDKWENDGASYVRNPKEGKTLAIGGLQLTIKTTGAETNGRFSLVEVTVPPYFTDISPHLHQLTTKAIYLIQGLLAVTIDEETMVVRPGSFILVRPHQVHRYWNPTATPTVFLAYFAPAGAEEFLEALSEMEWAAKSQFSGNLADLWALGMCYDHFPATEDVTGKLTENATGSKETPAKPE